jgi:hypothetical protein
MANSAATKKPFSRTRRIDARMRLRLAVMWTTLIGASL